jgi:hypothetical protein
MCVCVGVGVGVGVCVCGWVCVFLLLLLSPLLSYAMPHVKDGTPNRVLAQNPWNAFSRCPIPIEDLARVLESKEQ